MGEIHGKFVCDKSECGPTEIVDAENGSDCSTIDIRPGFEIGRTGTNLCESMDYNGLPYQYPPGFRFHPTDQELISHYLSKRVTGTLSPEDSIVAEVNLYKFNPWELPAKAFFGDGEWFFFSPRDRKYPNGGRPNRAAGIGYWKATGTDKPILAADGIQCLGVKKALVFYEGRPPKGIKTDWVMNEYRLLDRNTSWIQKHKGTMRLDDWVLCRVRQKGCFPQQGEEKQLSPNGFTIQQGEKPVESLPQWNDYQLFSYLMSSAEEADSACENSDRGSAKSSGGNAIDIMNGSAIIQPNMPSPTLHSNKRNLSFGLDEIMLSPSSKRPNCYNGVIEQFSPTGSFSVDQVYQF